jgi:magnesium-transporting ATPase (P-type)
VAAGVDVDVARTEAVLMLALGQLAYLFNCRFLTRSSLTTDVLRGNRAVWWSALALLVLQAIYTYVPFMHVLFDARPLALGDWVLPVVLAVAIFLAVEGLKAALRVRQPSSPAAAPFKGTS